MLRKLAGMALLAAVAMGLFFLGGRGVNGMATSHFSSDRAYAHVKAQVDIGVRAPGTPGHEKCVDYIVSQLQALKLDVRKQSFVGGPDELKMPMVNVVATLKGESPDTIVLGAHYDTKTFHDITFVGANDGGSGVGVLLELARVLASESKLPRTVEFVFFDGEESIAHEVDEVGLYGSYEYVSEAKKSGLVPRIKAFILLDMIGDQWLNVADDHYSTPWLHRLVWEQAESLGYAGNFKGASMQVIDDHVPFLQAKIPSLDLIDFDYGHAPGFNDYWHTDKDTLDKISPKSLEIIGRVVESSVHQLMVR